MTRALKFKTFVYYRMMAQLLTITTVLVFVAQGSEHSSYPLYEPTLQESELRDRDAGDRDGWLPELRKEIESNYEMLEWCALRPKMDQFS